MEYFVHIGDERLRVELDNGQVKVDGEPLHAELLGPHGHAVRALRADGRTHRIVPARNGRGRWQIDLGGERFGVDVLDRGQEAIREARIAAGGVAGPEPLLAPMPGLVLRIEVSEGDHVVEGQGIAIVEAMKMENELTAPADGVVARVHVKEGTAVDKGQLLVEFEEPDTAEPAPGEDP